ncbi:C2H2-type zinc finger protein [Vulcanisaeta sp. JCM 14467]|uniref:C2H2-type zinc finger protein n=1 Tax=Vulcanisaeta sp. JCM 14467 TaxID=1295370 RepID=UPI0006D1A9FB|nr:C2H2-type zinc finger protein [Vulcanisaeta sp. JCM 14467]
MPTCKLCGRSFDTMSELYAHLRSECTKIPRSRRCPVCGSKYRSIRFMKLHLINEAFVESKHMAYLVSI